MTSSSSSSPTSTSTSTSSMHAVSRQRNNPIQNALRVSGIAAILMLVAVAMLIAIAIATATATATVTTVATATAVNRWNIETSASASAAQGHLRHNDNGNDAVSFRWSESCPPPEAFRVRASSSSSSSSSSSWVQSSTISGFGNPSCCCSIADYGAIGDNSTLNTLAIQATIDGCHQTCGSHSVDDGNNNNNNNNNNSAHSGGGPLPLPIAVVYVPPGAFRTGSLLLRSNLRLHLGKGAALYGSDDPSDYPVVPMLPSGYETGQRGMWRALLSGTNLENVAITGENEGYAPGSLARFGDKQDQKTMMMTTTTTTMTTMFNGHNDADDASVSVIDGVGWKWWCKARSMPIPQDYCGAFNPHNETLPPDRFRPKLIEISESTNIVLDRFTARNSPVWFVHLFLTKNVVVTNLTVLAPREVGNTDGLDPDSCENVLIDSCYIDVGDDGVSIKSTNHTHEMAQTRNVTMRNLRIVSRNWCIGSATFGGVYDVLFEDSTIGDPDTVTSPWAIKFKSHRYYPGPMENITIRRISMGPIGPTPWMYPTAAGSALLLGLTYGEQPPPKRSGMPLFKNVTLSDIDVASAGVAGQIVGLPEDCLEGLTLRNLSVRGGAARWICQNVDLDSLVVSNVHPPVSCTGGCSGPTTTTATTTATTGMSSGGIFPDGIRYSFG